MRIYPWMSHSRPWKRFPGRSLRIHTEWGKPLDEPFDGFYSARRGTYRVIYRINEDKHSVEIHSVRHRRNFYRT